MKLRSSTHFYNTINSLVIVAVTTLPTMAQTFLQGTVKYFNSGSKPVVGIAISAFGSTAVYTGEAGMFILKFPDKKPGDPVHLNVGQRDGNGTVLELVNAKELEQIHLPSRADDAQFDIVVCRAGERNKAAQEYYDIYVKTADENLKKHLIRIEKEMKQDNITAATVESLQAEKDKLRTERDSAVAKAEEQAIYIANINLDRASDLVKTALKELREEKNMANAIAILDNQKLMEAYNLAHDQEKKAEIEIRQVIEGFKLKIKLLLPTYDQKEINQCCRDLKYIYANEKYGEMDEKYCFGWAVNNQSPAPSNIRKLPDLKREGIGCSEPSNLTRTGITSSSISFSWSGVSGATGYQAYYVRLTDSYTSSVMSTGSTAMTIGGLSAGYYRFYFATVCADGTSDYIITDDVTMD